MTGEKEHAKRRLLESIEGQLPAHEERTPPRSGRSVPEPAPATERRRQGQPGQQPAERQVDSGRSDALRRGIARRTAGTGDEALGSLASGETRYNIRFLSIAGQNEDMQRTIVSSWLGDEYLSLAPPGSPPRLHTERESYFLQFQPTLGSINGIYIGGTDDVHVSGDISGTPDRMRVIAHEDLHYFSRGGTAVYYDGPDGRSVRMGYVRWLNEGLTELFAQQVTRDHGITPSTVAYPFETSAACYLRTVIAAAIGDERRAQDILLVAYMTGNFTQVRIFIDMVLGEGTFDAFARKGTGAEALEFIETKVRELGDTSMLRMRTRGGFRLPAHWQEDPILRMARIQLALEGNFSSLAGKRGQSGFTAGRD